MDYVSDRLSDEMALWDVAVPHPRGGEPSTELIVPGRPFALRQRLRGDAVDGGWRVTGGRNRVADPNDAQIGLSHEQLDDAAAEKARDGGLRGDKAYCAQRTRPLLLIHVFTTQPEAEGKKLTDPVSSLSFCLPRTDKASTARTYQVNAVYLRQLEAEANSEAEDDEAILEAE